MLTVKEYVEKQKRLLLDKNRYEKPFQLAVRTVLARQTRRIFLEGLKSNGALIGRYNTTKPLYVDPDTAPRKSAGIGRDGVKIAGLKKAGKTGETVFKNGNAHKTAYVSSYADLRKKIGRQTSRIDLHFSGDLQLDFMNAASEKAPVNPTRISSTEYHVILKREGNAEKKSGLEKKYGKIFNLTKSERDFYFKTLDFEFRKAVAG